MKERFNELNNQYILSIDAETNGLWGEAFAIAGVLYDPQGKEVKRFVGRCPINDEVNKWVKKQCINSDNGNQRNS